MAVIIDFIANGFRATWLAAHGIGVAPGCRLGRGIRVTRGFRDSCKGRVTLGPNSDLQIGAVLEAWGGAITLGKGVFVGPYAVIYGHGDVDIGDHTLISMHCRIISSNHGVPPPGRIIRFEPDLLRPTKIGRDVWLGAGVTVLGGVTIGDGCVVGAGSVVTHDLPPNAIAVGVPARIAGERAASGP